MKKTQVVIIAVVVVVLLVVGTFYATNLFRPQPREIKKITVAFDWVFEGRHAPYFVAIDKGYYRDVGMDPEMLPGRGSQFSLGVVTSGKAEFGLIGAASLITARANGIPVVAVAMLYQQDPLGLWTLPNSGINSPKDLVGKKVGVRLQGTDFAEWRALLKQVGISSDQLQEVPVGFDPVQPLLTKQVDATLSWEEDRPQFEANGASNAVYIPFRNYGINFYITGIFVTEDFLQKNRQMVQDFVAASLKGWQASIKDPQGAITVLAAKSPDINKDRELKQLNLALQNRIVSDATKKSGIGYMETERWQNMVNVLFDNQVIKIKVDVKTLFTNDLLPNPPILPQAIAPALSVANLATRVSSGRT